jgi:hypothetical protein
MEGPDAVPPGLDISPRRRSLTAERAAQCDLVRELFGNPFRPPAVERAWLEWGSGSVRHLARVVYEEGRWEDLPVLADALEDPGCADETILAHCRQGGPHARGCWVVDCLLA